MNDMTGQFVQTFTAGAARVMKYWTDTETNELVVMVKGDKELNLSERYLARLPVLNYSFKVAK